MVESILSGLSSSSNSSKAASSGSDALGKDDFLQLLVTQLQHQDPLNPLDDKEFIAQLAQFSSLEQMNNIASGITSLNTTMANQDSLSAVNYIGKSVVASGDTVTKTDTAVTPIYFSIDHAAAKVTVNVYDENNNIVRTETLKSMQAGDYNYSWDGLDYNGKKASNGQYSVYFSAEDVEGDTVLVDTEVSGTIVGLQKDSEGTKFKLSDGRTVSFDDITMVVQSETEE